MHQLVGDLLYVPPPFLPASLESVSGSNIYVYITPTVGRATVRRIVDYFKIRKMTEQVRAAKMFS